MIDLDTIEREISQLEARDASYATIERLSWLYICRDHLLPVNSASPVLHSGGSEFLDAVSGKPSCSVFRVMDELMQVLHAVCPKEYESVIAEIEKIEAAK